MLLPEGVVHLGHVSHEGPVGREEVVEAHGVEDVVEVARRGDEEGPRDSVTEALFREKAVELLADRAGSAVEVILVVNRCGPEAVIAEEGEPAVQLGQILQVEAVDVQGVAELVIPGLVAVMLDQPVVEKCAHSSIPKWRAISTADRVPSSWNP